MENTIEKKKFSITASQLKWIAIILMVINHTCICLEKYGISDNYFVTTGNIYLTRISFVIFTYLVAEGMHYTRNRLKYIFYLFVFALISEIPYDLCFRGTFFNIYYQNIFWTLGLGAVAIYFIDLANKDPKKSILITLFIAAISFYMFSSYRELGVITIVSFYYFRDNKKKQLLYTALIFIVVTCLLYLEAGALTKMGIVEFVTSGQFAHYVFEQFHGLLALPLLALYKGEKGKNINKWFFYWFYPTHLLLLYLIMLLLIK